MRVIILVFSFLFCTAFASNDINWRLAVSDSVASGNFTGYWILLPDGDNREYISDVECKEHKEVLCKMIKHDTQNAWYVPEYSNCLPKYKNKKRYKKSDIEKTNYKFKKEKHVVVQSEIIPTAGKK